MTSPAFLSERSGREQVGWRPWLRLCRLPNTLTAAADVFAGGVLAGVVPWDARLWVVAAGSACLYAAGVALNDVLDRHEDQVTAPTRPIPRGDITVRGAWALVGVLALLGGASGAVGGGSHQVTTAGLALAILFYDWIPSRFRFSGAAMMGLCRSLNVLRGMTLATALEPTPTLIGALVGHGLFVLAITVVSTFEERPPLPRATPLLLAVPFLGPAVFGPVWLAAALLALVAWMTRPWDVHWPVGMVVRRAVFSIVFLDAAWVLVGGRPGTAVGVACLFPLMLWLAQAIRQRGA